MAIVEPGTALAKVLYYYGLIPGVECDEQKVVCPFHNDINPSMKVDLIKGTWKCFGCEASGDALKFVLKYEASRGLNEIQACKKYYQILKSDRVEAIDLSGRKPRSKASSKQSLVEAEDYYYCLSQDDWTKRPDDPDKRRAILYMKKRGFNFKILTEIGCKYTFNRNYELVFPMLDNGVFKGWVERTTDPEIEKKRKYLYNEGFRRRNTLVGNYEKDEKIPVYIVEGYMDMLKLKMFGVKYVVAILGWKISAEQIQKLQDKGIRRVVSALDNDACGIRGTEYLRQFFEVIRFQYEEKVKDPGEMNEESFKVMNANTIQKYKTERSSRNNGRFDRKVKR